MGGNFMCWRGTKCYANKKPTHKCVGLKNISCEYSCAIEAHLLPIQPGLNH